MFDSDSLNTHAWAKRKGILRPCSTCKKDYDPSFLDPEYFECPKCQKVRKIFNDNKKKRKELWDSIVWPNNTE